MDKITKSICCLSMQDALEQADDSPLTYSPDHRSYTISAPRALVKKNIVWLGYRVDFCPFCGTKLPKDLTEKWWDILEKEYGIDDPYDDKQKKLIPEEFKTDEWWKKRGL
ncbi:MAG: hypothetical protein P4L31_04165 [Candidatus Babeliales bacterium]|nr:hypothetical protein [Candidatus Babeliales bacterium]